MKLRKLMLLALSLGLGLACSSPALALKDGELKVDTNKTMTRGTKDGQAGVWTEQIRKTYRWTEDEVKLAGIEAFMKVEGRQPSVEEALAYKEAKKAAGNSRSEAELVAVAKNMVISVADYDAALAKLKDAK